MECPIEAATRQHYRDLEREWEPMELNPLAKPVEFDIGDIEAQFIKQFGPNNPIVKLMFPHAGR